MRNIPDKISRGNQNTHSAFSKCFTENLTVYEIMWKNIVQRGRPQMTIRRMRIACWIPKDTDIHSKYVTIIAFALQQWLHERISLLRHTYSASLNPHYPMKGTISGEKIYIYGE